MRVLFYRVGTLYLLEADELMVTAKGGVGIGWDDGGEVFADVAEGWEKATVEGSLMHNAGNAVIDLTVFAIPPRTGSFGAAYRVE